PSSRSKSISTPRRWSCPSRSRRPTAYPSTKSLHTGRTPTMHEQTLLLILVPSALAATLGLYTIKPATPTPNKRDERWQTIQLRARTLADATNWALLFLLLAASLLLDGQTTLTLNRVGTLYLIYFGFRNLVELCGLLVLDRRL